MPPRGGLEAIALPSAGLFLGGSVSLVPKASESRGIGAWREETSVVLLVFSPGIEPTASRILGTRDPPNCTPAAVFLKKIISWRDFRKNVGSLETDLQLVLNILKSSWMLRIVFRELSRKGCENRRNSGRFPYLEVFVRDDKCAQCCGNACSVL